MRWLSGNIRRKLTLFVVVILGIVVGLFWFFTVYMLKPAYNTAIRTELSGVLKTVSDIMDQMLAEGLEVVTMEPVGDDLVMVQLSEEFVSRLDAANKSGAINLTDRCLDIADTSLQCRLLVDGLEPRCALHPSHERSITVDGVHVVSELNSSSIIRLRQQVFAEGAVDVVENSQIIMGQVAANGSLSIIVSANQERIPQAIQVLRGLLFPLTIFIGLFAVLAAWAFSRWFTRPINRLSVAAREMARGNYDVRVTDCGDDEIGNLGRDFNTMAREVGRSAELQKDLLSNVSHDLRTPLTLIKGYAETVRDLTGDDAEKRTEQLNVIVDESDRLSALVRSVLELGRMSSGNEKPEMVRFDLSDLGDEVAYRYEQAAAQAGTNFVFEGEEGCYVDADPNLMERVLHNLLDNAAKHIGKDGFMGLKIYKTGYGMVRCEVTDHGSGVPEEDLPHIFDRYYRSRSDAGKPGTGLGLSITKAIFVAHGFDYGVQSKPGEGATFWFEAKLAAPVEPPPEGKPAKTGKKPMGITRARVRQDIQEEAPQEELKHEELQQKEPPQKAVPEAEEETITPEGKYRAMRRPA